MPNRHSIFADGDNMSLFLWCFLSFVLFFEVEQELVKRSQNLKIK